MLTISVCCCFLWAKIKGQNRLKDGIDFYLTTVDVVNETGVSGFTLPQVTGPLYHHFLILCFHWQANLDLLLTLNLPIYAWIACKCAISILCASLVWRCR